jgi:hypothetical protein
MLVDKVKTDRIEVWKAEIIQREYVKEILSKIKDDIGRYELDCRFADVSQTDDCTICNKNVFGSIYSIIDKYIEGSDSE